MTRTAHAVFIMHQFIENASEYHDQLQFCFVYFKAAFTTI